MVDNSSTQRNNSCFETVISTGTFRNGSNTSLLPERDLELAKVEVAVLAAVFVLATFSNLVVLYVLIKRRKYNTPMHAFMTNLCIADLVVAFFQVLPQLLWDVTDQFLGPDLLCRAVKYFQVVGMFASSYMIVAMTFDRHQAICRPMMTYRKGIARWNIPVIVAWTFSFLLSLPQIVIFSKKEIKPGVFQCWAHFQEPWGLRTYVTWVTVMVFILPAVIIAICQFRIFKEIHDNLYLKSERTIAQVKKQQQQQQQTSRKNSDDSGVSTAMSKTIRMTFVIVVIYIACWAPFFITQLWSVWDPHAPKEGVAFTILMLLASLNSCSNPWIYTAFSSSVSQELWTLLCCVHNKFRRKSIGEDSCITASSSLPKESLY
ncbi:vasopressin V2 receptor-like [Protopterus annectens]|uniref:Vasopressin V2 receptor n=1 Tax=Protopterus annectens TaxID=7888 RepID=B3XZZ4_PROAN|nr:vasopressin V2 receptor-like [Protopterus annectens]BAG66064.1 vasotocin type2 receptor [Protopterus annectens]